jgi:hypothetical protein
VVDCSKVSPERSVESLKYVTLKGEHIGRPAQPVLEEPESNLEGPLRGTVPPQPQYDWPVPADFQATLAQAEGPDRRVRPIAEPTPGNEDPSAATVPERSLEDALHELIADGTLVPLDDSEFIVQDAVATGIDLGYRKTTRGASGYPPQRGSGSA